MIDRTEQAPVRASRVLLLVALLVLAVLSLQFGPTNFDWLLARATAVVAVYLVVDRLAG
jgi:hypothetical protein